MDIKIIQSNFALEVVYNNIYTAFLQTVHSIHIHLFNLQYTFTTRIVRTIYKMLQFKVFYLALLIIHSNYANAITLMESSSQFFDKFYKETVALAPGASSIMSPISAEIALALLSLGAGGATQKELYSALNLPDSNYTTNEFKPFISSLNSIQGVTLNIANNIFIMNGLSLLPTFKNLAVDVFYSDVQNVDFANSGQAAGIINTWVEQKTNSKIKELIKSSSLSGSTSLVLVNAIYFKGNWENRFNVLKTKQEDFYISSNKTVKVDMMEQINTFPHAYIPEWNAEALEMFYSGKQMSMVIILPTEVDGLSGLEEKLKSGDLSLVFDKLVSKKISVSIPKFKIETEIDLNKVLPKVGVNLIFDPSKADLSGLIKNSKQLYVSEAIQKAFVEVNEEGTEAAAATAIIMTRSLPQEFRADHPFFFVIKSARGDIIFMGKKQGDTIEITNSINPKKQGDAVQIKQGDVVEKNTPIKQRKPFCQKLPWRFYQKPLSNKWMKNCRRRD
ncbi:alaserpin-like [Arctopsyche grandis]|uniref:alaserpin-like n=1 Tax=Arctopsyche grandis TaxID=121162 RepID=UPI00406D811A